MPAKTLPEWSQLITGARHGMDVATRALAELNEQVNAAQSQINAFAASEGVELNRDAVLATLKKPYVLRPTANPNTWELITWRGLANMPVVGWVKYQTDAFTVSEITRAMDVVSPAPQWMREVIGWQPPAFDAFLAQANTEIVVRSGSREKFKERYRGYLGDATKDGFKIKKGKPWLDFIGGLLDDGVVPFAQTVVDEADWDNAAPCSVKLRDYQVNYVDEFWRWGSCAIIMPPGGGKTYIMTYLAAHVLGPKCLFVDTKLAAEQWRVFLQVNAPKADVHIYLYQSGEKALKHKWTLALFDEFHRLPAATWSRYAFLDTKYRAGGTGTPWRSERESFLVLAGRPVAVPWQQLIAADVLRKPRAQIVVVKTQDDKGKWIKAALARHKSGRALIFAEGIDYGTRLANSLKLPFIHGGVSRQHERLLESEVAIVSKIGEQALDIPDLALVISADISRTGDSRTAEGQMFGRALHSHRLERVEYFVLLTPAELARYRGRFLGVSAELGDAYELIDLTGTKLAAVSSAPAAKARAIVRKGDAIGEALATPAVAMLLNRAYAQGGNKVRTERTLHSALRLAWNRGVSESEIRAARSPSVAKTLIASFKALEHYFLVHRKGTKWIVNRTKIDDLIAVNRRMQRQA